MPMGKLYRRSYGSNKPLTTRQYNAYERASKSKTMLGKQIREYESKGYFTVQTKGGHKYKIYDNPYFLR